MPFLFCVADDWIQSGLSDDPMLARLNRIDIRDDYESLLPGVPQSQRSHLARKRWLDRLHAAMESGKHIVAVADFSRTQRSAVAGASVRFGYSMSFCRRKEDEH